MRKNNLAGQSVLEYAVLFAVLLLALVFMGSYVRNVLAGKWREGAETFGQGEVYRPHISGIPSDQWTTETSKAENIR